MSLSRNLVAGMASSIWTALIGLAVVPLYLKYLGIEAYGLIGFFSTIQAVLSLLDMGLAPTINREVARCSASGKMDEARSLLHSLAIVYWAMACMIALAVAGLAPFIAEHWLQSKNLSHETISHAVMLMGLVAACRWPVGLYQGALMGLQKIALSSGVASAIGTFSSLGAISVLAFISPTIEAFFIWQACVGMAYAITMRWITWHSIGSKNRSRQFSFDALKRIWRFSAGMSGVALSATVFTQLDKLILSRTLSLKAFGHYMLATVIVSGMYLLIMPIFNAMYPRFSTLVVSGDTEKLTDLYRLSTRMLVSVLFPIATVLAIFAKDLVLVWTGNPSIALSVGPIITLLAIGSALHGIMFFPYALQLAYGMTRLPLMINTILMIALVPLIIYFSLKYGAQGGAIAWLVLHLLYVMLGTVLTHRHLLKGLGLTWLAQDIGIPCSISCLMGLIEYYSVERIGLSPFIKLTCAGGLALLTTLLLVVTSSKLRSILLSYLGWERGKAIILKDGLD